MEANLIIGGGITGLSAAWELTQRGQTGLLLERQSTAGAQPLLGGVMQTDQLSGCVVEAGPDSFLSAKPAATQLLRELGMEQDLIGSNDEGRVTFIVKDGRLMAMPDGLMMMVPTKILPMATSGLLSWATKIRMGLEYFQKPPETTRERSVAELIRQHYGQEAVDYLAEPLLAGVYGGDPEKLSADAVLAQFVAMEQKYGSLTKGTLAMRAARAKSQPGGPLFRTLKGGLGTWITRLQDAVSKNVRVAVGEAVAVSKRAGSGYNVRLADGSSVETQNLLLATPAYAAGAVLRGLDPTLASLLDQIPYNSSVTIALGYQQQALEKPMQGFGFLVPKRERGLMVACTFVQNKFAHRVPAGMSVARCFVGGSSFGLDDETLVQGVRQELAKLAGIQAEPQFIKVNRWNRAMAQYNLGHRRTVDEIRGRVAMHGGLQLAGNAYDGIGIPDCIRTGREAIAKLLQPVA